MKNFLNNTWLVSLTAGLLLALSFPPVNFSFLSFPAFILLIHLANSATTYRQVILYSYAGFLVWNLATTYWLMMATIGAGIAAIMANSLLMTFPLCLMVLFERRFSSAYLIAFLQASAWVGYEFLHHNWDLAWPWLAIGNGWSNQISLIQYISITGHLGISFWVVFTSALAWQALKLRRRPVAIATIISLMLLPTFSLFYFAVYNPYISSSESTKVTVIQPNHDSYEDYGGMSGPSEVLDSLFSVTSKVKSDDTDLIVWPENSIDRPINMNSFTTQRIADSARAWNASFIIGAGLITFYENEEPEIYYGISRGIPYNVFNSTLFVDELGELSRYDKAKLVPFVERTPFLPFFRSVDLFDWVDWGRIRSYGKGSSPDMLQSKTFTTPGLVCYDSVYPSWIREFVKRDADFITIITNDGWWGNSSGHLQHFSYARLRAIEFNRWVVRSANNGTSGIIRPDGSVEQKTDYWIRTGFNSTIPKLQTKTLYTLFGDWLSYLCLLAVIVGLVVARSKTNKTATES